MTRYLTAAVYCDVRARLADRGHGDDYTWSQGLKPPATARELVSEYVWVVLNSGMKNTIARKIMDRVWPALMAGAPVADVFGHREKAAAIEDTWRRRIERFADFTAIAERGDAAVAEWCETLPWIGKITKYHLAKNLGADVAKPDRWLIRLADVEQTTVRALCAVLAAETGDRVATVDIVLWRACAVGVLAISDGAILVCP